MCSVEICLLFRGFGSLLLFWAGGGEDTGGEMEMIKWDLFLLMLGEVAWYNGNSFGLRMKKGQSLISIYVCIKRSFKSNLKAVACCM